MTGNGWETKGFSVIQFWKELKCAKWQNRTTCSASQWKPRRKEPFQRKHWSTWIARRVPMKKKNQTPALNLSLSADHALISLYHSCFNRISTSWVSMNHYCVKCTQYFFRSIKELAKLFQLWHLAKKCAPLTSTWVNFRHYRPETFCIMSAHLNL